MLFLYVATAVAAAYAVFIAAPAVVMYLAAFSPKKPAGADALFSEDDRFRPYADLLRGALEKVRALPREEVSVRSEDGFELGGTLIGTGRERAVLFAHGYRSDAESNFALQAERFASRGYAVLFIRQRAHPGSGGRRITLGLAESRDILAWTDFLKERGFKEAVVYGTSMGGAAAAYASPELDPAFVRTLVIDCAFESPYAQMTSDCRKRRLPDALIMPPVRLIARVGLHADLKTKTSDSLKKCRVPAFFLHGTSDGTVGFERCLEGFAACASDKELLAVEGADHTLAFAAGGSAAADELFAFINRHL
ncbi:MAG: alpha/beta hydrolase [Clostridia bacterium]|nr:alpha/beta hydrolase [Clostridia bacterium]